MTRARRAPRQPRQRAQAKLCPFQQAAWNALHNVTVPLRNSANERVDGTFAWPTCQGQACMAWHENNEGEGYCVRLEKGG